MKSDDIIELLQNFINQCKIDETMLAFIRSIIMMSAVQREEVDVVITGGRHTIDSAIILGTVDNMAILELSDEVVTHDLIARLSKDYSGFLNFSNEYFSDSYLSPTVTTTLRHLDLILQFDISRSL